MIRCICGKIGILPFLNSKILKFFSPTYHSNKLSLIYICISDCGSVDGTLVFGLSPQPYTIGISCLRKVEEIVESAHIRAHEYYVLPMKLPNRCVTQQLCLTPSNPFYNHLPGHRSSSKLLHWYSTIHPKLVNAYKY